MSNPMGYDYPAGAEHDPDAPWNQHDGDECEECDGTGTVKDKDGEDVECPICDGKGCVAKLSREEIAIEKADRDMDEEKDREAQERK